MEVSGFLIGTTASTNMTATSAIFDTPRSATASASSRSQSACSGRRDPGDAAAQRDQQSDRTKLSPLVAEPSGMAASGHADRCGSVSAFLDRAPPRSAQIHFELPVLCNERSVSRHPAEFGRVHSAGVPERNRANQRGLDRSLRADAEIGLHTGRLTAVLIAAAVIHGVRTADVGNDAYQHFWGVSRAIVRRQSDC